MIFTVYPCQNAGQFYTRCTFKPQIWRM